MDFLRKKWSIYFTIIDVNHDGIIAKADVDKTLKDFPVVEGLSEEEGKLADDRLENWWETYIMKGRDNITRDEFVDDLEKEYTKDKEAFIKTMIRLEEDIHDIVNVDKSKFISADRFTKVLNVFGHKKTEVVRKSFDKQQLKDGKIPLQQSIDNWVELLTGDDETKPGVVMETSMFLTE